MRKRFLQFMLQPGKGCNESYNVLKILVMPWKKPEEPWLIIRVFTVMTGPNTWFFFSLLHHDSERSVIHNPNFHLQGWLFVTCPISCFLQWLQDSAPLAPPAGQVWPCALISLPTVLTPYPALSKCPTGLSGFQDTLGTAWTCFPSPLWPPGSSGVAWDTDLPTPSGLCHASIIILAKLHHPGHVPFTVSCPCPGSVTTETALWNPTAISSPRRKSLSPNSCEVWEHTLLGGNAAASAISLNGLDHILGQGLKSLWDFSPCPSCCMQICHQSCFRPCLLDGP